MKINVINKQFNVFSKQTLKKSNTDTRFLYSQIQKHADTYKQVGCIEVFVQKAHELAEECLKAGLSNFTGIIYSFLVKNEQLPFELKEILIKRSLEIAKINDDPIHQLARIVDLKHLYYKNPKVDQKKYLETLFMEEDALKNIVRNYEDCSEKFRTVESEHLELEEYKYYLGHVNMEIANCVITTDKKFALKKLKIAMKLFSQLGKTKEEFQAYGLINKLKH